MPRSLGPQQSHSSTGLAQHALSQDGPVRTARTTAPPHRFENVRGILHAADNVYIKTRDALRSMGYHVDGCPGRGRDSASSPSTTNADRIRFLFDHDLYGLPDSERANCHGDNDHSYRSVYGRLKWTEPAQTITTG
jgi:site-specific DNA-cytosine methylase